MKLTFYEIKKVISQRVFITILILSLILNGFLLAYTQLNRSDSLKNIQSESYSQAMSEYSKMSTDKAIEKIKDKLLSYDILTEFQYLAISDDAEMAKDTYNTLKEYKKTNPTAYAEAEKMSESDEDFTNEKEILEDISAQLDYIKSYPSFINEMDERAQSQSKAKLFNDESSFSYKNLFKTADDYRGLKNTQLQLGKSGSLLAVGEFKITDYLIIAIVFLICVYLFSTEKEKGLYNLVRSTKKGRLATILSKLIALVILSVVVSVVFTVLDFAVASCIYGFDSFNVSMQSFSEFRNCILDVKVWQYYLIYIVSKALTVLAFSVIFALIFVCVSSAFVKYISGAVVVGVEYVLYAFIPTDSPISFLKFINIFYFVDSQQLLSKYLNLNIFGEAVNIFTVALITLAVIFIVASLIVSMTFVMKNQQKKTSRVSGLTVKFKTRFFKINGSTNLLRGEVFKYLVQNKLAILFVLLIGFSVFNCFESEEYIYSSQSDVIYKGYMQYLEGEITPEKEKYISEREEYIAKLEEKLEDSDLSEGMADVISNMIEIESEALNKVQSQYQRIKELSKTDSNAKFIDENIYSRFIFNSQREWLNLVFLGLLIIISSPILYTCEYKNNVINLIRPNKKGKLRLWLCKLSIGAVATVLAFACVYVPYLVRFINSFGTSSFATSLQSVGLFENATGVTVIGAFVVEMVAYFFLALLIMAVVTFISVFLENNLVSMLMSSVVVLIPCIMINGSESARVGQMFSGNWQMIFAIIVIACILVISALWLLSGIKFTRTKLSLKKIKV